MGYMFVYGPCFGCKRPFGYNADYVPSIRVNAAGQPDPHGDREPVCADCIAKANAQRAEMGLPPHPVHPDAYEPGEVM